MLHIRKTSVFIAIFAGFISLMSASNLPFQKVMAQSEITFGPENFVRGNGEGKPKFTRSFSAANTLIPYTLTAINGDSNGSQFVKRATITLNGQELVTLNKGLKTMVLAVRLQAQNTLSIVLKSSNPDSFVKVSIEPTRTTLFNSPNDADFDSRQAGVGHPVSASVDSASHRAYIADAGRDAIIEFDLIGTRLLRTFDNVDGNAVSGDSRTSGVCVNPSARNLVAVSPADSNAGDGMLSIINLDSGTVRRISQGSVHPFSLASNANTNTAAFTALFNPNNRRAYFLDISSGTVTTRDESFALFAVANNSMTNEFVFAGSDASGRSALVVYEARAPFRRLKEIATSARANTLFDKIAINPANNFAVALNLREGAVFIFDLAAGQELARIPIRVVRTDFAEGDVAINPETNMAVVVNKSLNMLYIIDLATLVLRAELPLPEGSSPTGVGVDTQLNRAAVTETGFSSTSHNGSVLVVQLPQR